MKPFFCVGKNEKIQSMATVGGKQGASRTREVTEGWVEKCFLSALNKRILRRSCLLQSVTCFLYLKQETFTCSGGCGGCEDSLSGSNTAH